ncbi:hypothetical protein HPB49_007478 [Dermacentor silvarum]|uniref:Uncharacterized protein n=1 Tax=Dermacentor silvarum TaxID=543639 RepID=A0ACB8DIM1_DERSI|nr:hypothetical protein HPB49_007478 [Dermacentor silvarum]
MLGKFVLQFAKGGESVDLSGRCAADSTEEELEPQFVVERAQGTNVLGLLVFAVFVGAIIASTGERNRAMHDLVVSITDIMMSLIRIIMWSVSEASQNEASALGPTCLVCFRSGN